MQRSHACDDRRERGGNFGVARIRPVLFAIDHVAMNFGVKGLGDLTSRTGELDHVTRVGDTTDLETVLLEPAGNLCEIGVRNAEALAELSGCKPFVILRRLGIELCL